MRSFASDNNSGVHPLVMEALNQANQDHAVGYGDDAWTEEAVRKSERPLLPIANRCLYSMEPVVMLLPCSCVHVPITRLYVRKLRIFM